MRFMDLASPFAIYENGDGYVLPNVLPEVTREVLLRLEQEPLEDVLASLRVLGRQILAHNTSAQDAAKVWNFFLAHYLTQYGAETPSSSSRAEMLKLMLA